MMKSEETLRLCRDEMIRLDGDVAGRVILCRKGILWLTQAGAPGDHLIRAGEGFAIDRPQRGPGQRPRGIALHLIREKANSPRCGMALSYRSSVRMARRFEAARKSLLA